ncbi:helix-turn-helix domain-containing protein [Sphingobacterium sp. SGR-19]|nr:helix-turn-helix domain-containing protein [Sphingobacterium sp. SGR-19]NGM64203.1 helix-turn-helix domain-containing protein [Sphingobacterium sp. SGR-19]
MIRLHEQGYAIKSIARSLGISKNTVCRNFITEHAYIISFLQHFP